jgi:hypothetical protein
MPLTQVPASMCDLDVATQAELDAVAASIVPNVKLTGDTVQVVNFQTGAVATGTTILPVDDTIPQITEGTEFMTLAITPTNASNKLRIDVTMVISHSAANSWLTAALFQDSNANALACAPHFQTTAAASVTIHYSYWMTAGTTSATTFRVRGGSQTAGTTTFNGAGAARYYGGVIASSITITEFKA